MYFVSMYFVSPPHGDRYSPLNSHHTPRMRQANSLSSQIEDDRTYQRSSVLSRDNVPGGRDKSTHEVLPHGRISGKYIRDFAKCK